MDTQSKLRNAFKSCRSLSTPDGGRSLDDSEAARARRRNQRIGASRAAADRARRTNGVSLRHRAGSDCRQRPEHIKAGTKAGSPDCDSGERPWPPGGRVLPPQKPLPSATTHLLVWYKAQGTRGEQLVSGATNPDQEKLCGHVASKGLIRCPNLPIKTRHAWIGQLQGASLGTFLVHGDHEPIDDARRAAATERKWTSRLRHGKRRSRSMSPTLNTRHESLSVEKIMSRRSCAVRGRLIDCSRESGFSLDCISGSAPRHLLRPGHKCASRSWRSEVCWPWQRHRRHVMPNRRSQTVMDQNGNTTNSRHESSATIEPAALREA